MSTFDNMSLPKIAAALATTIAGISPDASRERAPEESVFAVRERCHALDKRAAIEALLLAAFAKIDVRAAEHAAFR